MRSHFRAIAFAISLSAATLATAQTSTGADNPTARSPGGEVHFYGERTREDSEQGVR